MNASLAYWAANVAGLDDPSLLRFLVAVEQRRDKYAIALQAATTGAEWRRLVKKKAALAGGQSSEGGKP
ncbi:MAG: hypothetical protein ABFD85_16175 [Phycisphaerae bacterium]